MPDPVLFAQAVVATAVAGAIFVLAAGWTRKSASARRVNVASILAIGLATALGYDILKLLPRWPPVNVLDRFVILVLPAAILVELVAAARPVPRPIAWLLRAALAAAAGRVLLHGSSYLDGTATGWTVQQTWTALAVAAVIALGTWGLLSWLARRSPGVSIPLAIAQTAGAGALAVMVSGYLNGGAAGLPLAAALSSAALAACLLDKHPTFEGAIGLGIVGLIGVIIMGRFFGELPTGRSLALFLAPLLCWGTELPMFKNRKPWLIGTSRLALVAVPLIVVLILVERDFSKASSAPADADASAAGPPRSQALPALGTRWARGSASPVASRLDSRASVAPGQSTERSHIAGWTGRWTVHWCGMRAQRMSRQSLASSSFPGRAWKRVRPTTQPSMAAFGSYCRRL